MKTSEDKLFNGIGHIFMFVMSVAALVPLALLVISSFSSEQSLVANGYSFLPAEFSLEAYRYMFSSTNKIINAYGISFLITTLGTAGSLVLTTLLSYPLSRRDLPFRNVIAFFVFFTMLFNGGLVPTYLMYTGVFHIKNTLWALLVPSLLMNGYNIMLMRSYFVTSIPGEIIEAAHIDGASEFRTFAQIVLPMAKPIVATVGIFVGIAYWNDWNNGYIYISSRTELYSIQNLLNRMIQNIQFLSQNASQLSQASEGLSKIPTSTVRMSMAVMGVLPIVLIYPFVQNNFVKGITLGGVKG